MVRETRHLWVGNLPENIREETILDHFQRFGPVQSVKILWSKKDGIEKGDVGVVGCPAGAGGVGAATVAFMDIKSAGNAVRSEHSLEGRLLRTDYYDPSCGQRGSVPVRLHSLAGEEVYESGAGSVLGSSTGSVGAGGSSGVGVLSRTSHGFMLREFYSGSRRYGEDYIRGRRSLTYGARLSTVSSSGSSSSTSCSYGDRHYWTSGSAGGCGPGPGPSSSTCSSQYLKEEKRLLDSGSRDSSTSSSSRSSSSSSSRSSSRSSLCRQPGGGSSSDDITCFAILLRNLPNRLSDLTLQDSLFHEYNKISNVKAVRVSPSGRISRYAVIYFASYSDISEALNETRNRHFFNANLEAEIFLAGDELIEDKRIYHRPPDGELDEFHPKATRVLYIGNLSRSEVTLSNIHHKFKDYGTVLDIDLKKPGYAYVQYMESSSVVRAIRELDGANWCLDSSVNIRLKLGFGRSAPTKCVWLCNLAECVTEKLLLSEFGKFGKIQDILIDKTRKTALVYYDQAVKAHRGLLEMRGKVLKGKPIQTDYASHECRTAFFEQCKDVRMRTRTWEEEEKFGRKIEYRSMDAPTCRTKRYEDYTPRTNDYEEELKRFQNDRVNNYEFEKQRNYQRNYSENKSLSNIDSSAITTKRYKPLTRAISPPRLIDERDLRDSLNRKTRHRCDVSSKRLLDPRRNKITSDDEKGKKKCDFSISEDLCSTDSSSSNINILVGLANRRIKLAELRRLSSDSTRSLDLSVFNIDKKTSLNSRRLSSSADSSSIKDENDSDLGDSSRPGTPLCDEKPENLNNEAPVRLSSHLRSAEPMHLPLPRFAHDVLSPKSTGSNSNSIIHICGNQSTTTSETSERDLRLKSLSPKMVICNSNLALDKPSDPRLIPAIKSPNVDSDLDSEKEVGTDLRSLEERIRDLDEKYQKWSGSTKGAVSPSNVSIIGSQALSPLISQSLPNHPTVINSSNKYNLDLKPAQPSAIVQILLSRKSVFDEDSKRLECRKTHEEIVSTCDSSYTNSIAGGHTSNFVGNSFSRSTKYVNNYNNISTLPDKPVITSVASSDFSSLLPREIPTMPANSGVPIVTIMQTPSIPPLPSVAGTSTTTNPIKPLVDKRQMISTKPSATVTPTFKSSSVVTIPVIVPSQVKQQLNSVAVNCNKIEKGEASSTTSSPKLNLIKEDFRRQIMTKYHLSPKVSKPDHEKKSDVNITPSNESLSIVKLGRIPRIPKKERKTAEIIGKHSSDNKLCEFEKMKSPLKSFKYECKKRKKDKNQESVISKDKLVCSSINDYHLKPKKRPHEKYSDSSSKIRKHSSHIKNKMKIKSSCNSSKKNDPVSSVNSIKKDKKRHTSSEGLVSDDEQDNDNEPKKNFQFLMTLS
ncbi:Protein split ends [Lepeophtheirus salmonis]|uniref:Protein split ends n=1 Tax=Lepeophtheirus salmonis TaxID=72036 RepID=A0A7R8H1X8_LEPSM|nr:Protein split ends [Lepeophtheirus salmonis]CAF2815676.1 Protein split ends [Lepeophtheirus salmonis]